jgi:hypothetical protein
MSPSRLALLLALLVPAAASAEQFYKWKDETGAWNYTAQPPKDKASVAVNLATGVAGLTAAAKPPEDQAEGGQAAPGGAQAAAPGGAQPPTKQGQELELAQVAETRARLKAEQNANCERARTNVATLESSPKVTLDRNDGGGERILNDDEQMQELIKARRQVEVFCSGQ